MYKRKTQEHHPDLNGAPVLVGKAYQRHSLPLSLVMEPVIRVIGVIIRIVVHVVGLIVRLIIHVVELIVRLIVHAVELIPFFVGQVKFFTEVCCRTSREILYGAIDKSAVFP